MPWKAVSSSVTGTSHQKKQIPCQDYGGYFLANDCDSVFLGAVADGAGSAKHSHIGSKLAVEVAISKLNEYLRKLKNEKQYDLQQPISQAIAQDIFIATVESVVHALTEEAKNKDYLLNHLACTLLVFIATPNWIAAMQIGDGFIVVRMTNSDCYQLLFQPNKGEYANETAFVTSSNAQSEMQIQILVDKPKFICASTDGLERIALNFNCGNWTAGTGFFKPFEDGLEINNQQQETEDIHKWLESPEVNSHTDDDKTLLLCLYDEEHVQQNYVNKIKSTEESSFKLQKQEESSCVTFFSQTPISSQKKLSLQRKFPLDLISLSFICYIFATGCLWNIIFYLSSKSKNISANILFLYLLIIVIFIIVVFCIKFRKLSKFYQKSKRHFYKAFLLSIITSSLGIIFGTLLFLPLQYLSFR